MISNYNNRCGYTKTLLCISLMLQGYRGDPGNPGRNGIKGQAGPKGDTGIPGPQGPKVILNLLIKLLLPGMRQHF